jgi:signal transduction histidine kinase
MPAVEPATTWVPRSPLVLPVAAAATGISAFLTAEITPTVILVTALGLLPWALVAGEVAVPRTGVVVATGAAATWLVLVEYVLGALFPLMVLIVWLAAGTRRLAWPAAVSVAGSALAWRFYEIDQADLGGVGLESQPAWWVFFATGFAFAWFVGALVRRERELVTELREARDRLADAALADERRRIARDVHDIVGHSLTVVLLHLAGARRILRRDPDAAVAALARAEDVGRESLDQIRHVVGLLRDDSPQPSGPAPTAADVTGLVEQAVEAGMTVELTVHGDLHDLDAGAGLTVYRVVQESIANADHHAPGAAVVVTVDVDDTEVAVDVRNGPSRRPVDATAPRSGTGLAGMRERVGAAEGTLRVGPTDDGGWSVVATVPRHRVAR